MLGRGTGSKGKTESALVYFFVANRLHILLMLCCGGGFRFFFFFWLLLLLVVVFVLRGGSSESLEELYPNLLRSRWIEGRAVVEGDSASAISYLEIGLDEVLSQEHVVQLNQRISQLHDPKP